MKSLVLTFLLFVALIGNSNAQSNADTFETTNGKISIQPKLHSSMIIDYNGTTIAVDPYGGKEQFGEHLAPELILITDIHGDHLNQATLNALDTRGSIFIVPEAVAKKLPPEMAAKAVVIKNGQGVHRYGIFIMAIPMYNMPETADSRHPKGRGNGYILEIDDYRIYISGDTSAIEEMKMLRDIDIAFVCMNLPYTMDVNEAAAAVLSFAPKTVYPYHFRGNEGFSDVEKFKKLVISKNKEINVLLRDWYPVN